jgi:4-hydroxy-4-methyl-2-oxoglutarate aldolase
MMPLSNPLPSSPDNMHGITASLRRFDTCLLSDALEQMGLQLHNRGFTQPGLQCFAGPCGTLVGYAVTARVMAAEPPMVGNTRVGHMYFRHTEWWAEMNRQPKPRIVVIEDIDRHPGAGACVGKVGAAVFSALHCIGAVTNGAVRELQDVSETGFTLFAGHLSPSRAYAHLVDHSSTVEIYGLKVVPGDMLAADRHGVLSIPPEALRLRDGLPEIVKIAAEIQDRKRSFVSFCNSDKFSLEGMEDQLKQFRP